jgi:hypothetical protein
MAGAVHNRKFPRRLAQRLIGRTEDVVAPVDQDPNRRCHAWLEQQIRIGGTDDDIIGLDLLLRWADLRYLSGKRMVGEGRYRDRGLVAELELADVLLAEDSVEISEGEIRSDQEERGRV